MKNLFLVGIAALVSVSVATAQTEKGRWTVGASVGNFQYSSQNQYRSFSGSISALAGYFVANSLVIGTGLPMSLSTTNYPGYKYVLTGVGLSPFVRYYLGSKVVRPYVGLTYSYTHNRQHIDNPIQNSTATGYTSSVLPTVGVAWFINRTAALNAGLSYVYQRSKNASSAYDAAGNPIEIPVSTSKYLSLGIGFQLFFGK